MVPSLLPAPIAAKIRVDPATGCWLWTGAIAKDGYGTCNWPPVKRGTSWRAHRLVWTLLKGPIPPGMPLDHRCHVLACVFPGHLQIATIAENNARRRSNGRQNTDRCRNGHPWVEANIYTKPSGVRGCRRCIQEQTARRVATGQYRKARPSAGQSSLL